MDVSLRVIVRQRANDSCEYCQRRQSDSPLISFHVEHIIARKHGGTDDIENLALACAECNLHKGSDLSGIDPVTSAVERLYDPRSQAWRDHFCWQGLRIEGLTPTGRATVSTLDLNSLARLRVRLAVSR